MLNSHKNFEQLIYNISIINYLYVFIWSACFRSTYCCVYAENDGIAVNVAGDNVNVKVGLANTVVVIIGKIPFIMKLNTLHNCRILAFHIFVVVVDVVFPNDIYCDVIYMYGDVIQQ